MALTQTLTDTFPGSSLSALWTATGTVSVSGGKANVQNDTGFTSGFQSATTYSLIGSFLLSKAGTVQAQCWMQVSPNTGPQTTLSTAGMEINGTGQLEAFWSTSGGVYTSLATATYNPVTHAWWRIRESGGTLFYEFSADGLAWSSFASVANPITLTTVFVQFGAGGASPTVSAQFTDVNTVPGGQGYTPVVLTPPGLQSPAAWAPFRPGNPVLPTPYTEGDPAAASATATAQAPVTTVVVTPGVATATAQALTPGISSSDSATPTLATASAAAKTPVATVIVIPGVATATAQALQPSAGNITTVTPGVATATATAQAPGLQISATVTPGTATATAAAKTPVAVVTAAAGHPSATAQALAPGLQISRTVVPGVATATATAALVSFPTRLVNWGVTFFEHTLNAVVTVLTLDASLAPRSTNATLSVRTLNAVVTEGTMQQATLTLAEFNDMTIDFAVTANGAPYNLTGMVLNLLLKSAAGTPDSSALILSSSGGSPAITITSPTGGLATAQIPNADLDIESYNFYRLDVVNGSAQQQTTVYGSITWITL